LEYINNGERNILKATRTEVNFFRLKDRMYLRIVELVWMGLLIGFSISRITSDFVDTGMLGWFEGLDIYGIFLRKILRDINSSRRDLKLAMERKAKIERKKREYLETPRKPDVPCSLETDPIHMNTSRKLIL